MLNSKSVSAGQHNWASLMAQQVKNLLAMQESQEMWVQSLGQEDPLEKEMASQYSCLKIPTDRGAWRAPIQWVSKESDMTERPSLHACIT